MNIMKLNKFLIALCITISPNIAGANEWSPLVPVIEILSAYAWKDNYKKVPQLNPSPNSIKLDKYPCKEFISEDSHGTACLQKDGTWEIKDEW